MITNNKVTITRKRQDTRQEPPSNNVFKITIIIMIVITHKIPQRKAENKNIVLPLGFFI